jgi:hypothetical protein
MASFLTFLERLEPAPSGKKQGKNSFNQESNQGPPQLFPFSSLSLIFLFFHKQLATYVTRYSPEFFEGYFSVNVVQPAEMCTMTGKLFLHFC